MKAQKRDRSNRAYTRGIDAGASGKTKDLCPFSESRFKQEWLNGWRQGRNILWESGLKN